VNAVPDEELLLAVLNSTPVVDGLATDTFADPARARAWLAASGGRGTAAELAEVIQARELLQAVVLGQQPARTLAPLVDGVTQVPDLGDDGIRWQLSAPPERELAVRTVLAWDALEQTAPGRLRPCANPECRLFLIDHSKAGTARWCSMATCGNRMKARRHYQRAMTPRQT